MHPYDAQQLAVVRRMTRDLDLPVSIGRFGARMEVELVSDGPVTIVLSSGEPAWPADAG